MIDEKKLIDKDIENPVEKIVTSLEVSRKLKALGIIQESCFYWVRTPVYSIDGAEIKWVIVDENELMTYLSADEVHDKISAFTVTELGAMMDNGMIFDGISNVCAPPDTFANVIIKGSQYLVFDWLNQNLKEWRDK